MVFGWKAAVIGPNYNKIFCTFKVLLRWSRLGPVQPTNADSNVDSLLFFILLQDEFTTTLIKKCKHQRRCSKGMHLTH